MKTIKGFIFDLDMCILNTRVMPGGSIDPVLDILKNSTLPEETKQQVDAALWTTALDDVLDSFAVPQDIAEPMREAHRLLEPPAGLETFGDENYVKDLPGKKYLVTSGYIRFQQGKMDQLGIADLFDEIVIDALDVQNERKGKTVIFKEILENNEWAPEEVLVIGDNPHSEIAAAEELGIPTVQTLRPTVVKYDSATHHMHSFDELASIVDLYT